MTYVATVIAGIFGLLFGGFPGLIIGLLMGYCIDSGMIDRWRTGQHYFQFSASQIQEIFFNVTFQMMGFVAKADGRVSARDIQTAETIMKNLGLNVVQRERAIQLFNEGKQPRFNAGQAIQTLKQACWHKPSLLRTFLEMQVQMAFSEGSIDARKRAALHYICQQLGVMGFNFDQFESQFRAEQQYHRSYSHQRTGAQRRPPPVQNAYSVLGVSSEASQTEVKKAYRRLMSRYHPDRLIAKGLPEEMIKVATEKTQTIKKAYDDICQKKGWA
ncbi:MAG TPA: co-chaperone DjlA [Coxiellaceae bacterium]|nr:co-chaperone DjlA [Coxiellaceae bacterium]